MKGGVFLTKQFTLKPNGSFCPKQTFLCGQCFRWNEQADGSFIGVVGDTVARVYKNGESFQVDANCDCETALSSYLDLERDYDKIRTTVSIDSKTALAADFGAGIRILKQEPWEALCSFIISQCNNIPRIKLIISKLCFQYGKKIEWGGETYYTFPTADDIAGLSVSDLDFLKSGYRAPYILGAARAVSNGQLDFDALRAMNTIEAKKQLLMLDGVGDKVASCMLLFGLGKLDAFPVDVWVHRVTEQFYGKGFDPSKAFGEYAGIAQQYLFYYARENKLV